MILLWEKWHQILSVLAVVPPAGPDRISVMPVPAMAQPVIDHQKRFQAAVDVIQNLPKNGK